ncbi:hypothetical protein LCGC14_0582310, partial [marine sediment metagenome]
MAVSTSFNPPQFEDEYDGLKMRQLVDELMRTQAELNRAFDWILAKQEALQFTGADGVPVDAISFVDTPGDSDFASVRLLVDADGADAATSYTERSVNAAAATFVANAQLDTDQFKFGTASILLDGTGDYVTFPDDPALELGSGVFTIEGWVRLNTVPAVGESMSLISQWEGVGTERAFDLFIHNHAVFGFSLKFEWVDSGGAKIQSGSIDPVDPVANTWYHFTVIRKANDALFIWWDGAREFNSSPGIFSGTIDNTTVTTKLGVRDPGVGGGNEQYLDGWLDDVRITVGVERYDTTTDLTPPSAAFLTVGDVTEFTFGNSSTTTNFDGDLTLTGRLVTDDSTATRSGFNIPTGVAPTSSVQGDIWVTASDILVSLNGVDQSLVFVDYDQTVGDLVHILEIANTLQMDATDITVSSDGAAITFSLEKEGGGDIRILFSDGVHTHDTDPTPDSVALNAGTDVSPQINFVYILQSDKALTVSTSDWPSAEHSRLATVFCQSAASAQTDGVYKMHAWSDHTDEANAHHTYWMRSQPATWKSGTLATTSVGAATFDIAVATGVIQQMHNQTYPAFDTATGSEIMIVNQNGTAFDRVGNMVSQITDASGGSMSGKYYNLVVWGVVSEDAGDCQLMVNLPTASYNTSARAILDADATTVYDIPTDFVGVGFLIARLVVRHQAGGNTYSISSNIDLRGKVPSTSAGGTVGGGVTALADLSDVSQVSPTQFHALARNSGNTAWESRLLVEADISDLQAYLTSIPTHTGHVTGDTALTLVVAAITGQTALASGLADTDEFLINDAGVIKRMDASVLATYIGAVTSEVNDLTATVTWANVPDANITQGSVTQHQAALSIAETQIPDGSLLAREGANADFDALTATTLVTDGAGDSSFVGDVGIGTASPQKNLHIESTVPTIRLSDSNAATDQAV